MKRLVDITKDFIANSKPKIGKVIIENGIDYHTHIKEISTAYWLFYYFGGEIIVLKEKNQYLIYDPDYCWNDRFWDLKCPTKKKSIIERLRKGLKQTSANRGGLIFDISNSTFDFKTLINIINNEINSYKEADGVIIIKKDRKLIKVLLISK